MDVKEAERLSLSNPQTAERIKKCVEWIEKKILKAIKKGRWDVKIDTFPEFPFSWNPCKYLDDEERRIIKSYLIELGFETGNSIYNFEVSWRPSNFDKIYMPCTENSKLKHVILAGQEPKVIV